MLKEKQSKAFKGFFKKVEKKEDQPEPEEKPGFGIPFQVEYFICCDNFEKNYIIVIRYMIWKGFKFELKSFN